jgi:hypothetical protein
MHGEIIPLLPFCYATTRHAAVQADTADILERRVGQEVSGDKAEGERDKGGSSGHSHLFPTYSE